MEQGRYRTGEQKTAAGKQDDKIAKAMNLLNQRKKQTEEKEEMLRALSQPRSKKYIECVQKTIALSRRYKELEERKKALAGKSAKGAQKAGETEAKKGLQNGQNEALAEAEKQPEKEVEKGWWETKKDVSAESKKEADKESKKESETGWWNTAKETSAETEKQTEKGWWDEERTVSEEPEFDNSILEELERELEQIKQEMEELDKELKKEMPWFSQFLGHIFPCFREAELIRRGFDLGPPGGEPFSTMSEMFEQVQPPTEHERNQWELAYKVLHQDRPRTLIVEIYWTAVCAVFEDGSTKVVTGV